RDRHGRRDRTAVSDLRSTAIALAEEIIAAHPTRSRGDGDVDPASLIWLRVTLGKIIGAHGFDVMLARALTLAQRQDTSLAHMRAEPGGGFTGLGPGLAQSDRSLVVVLSQLFELLIRLIGEDLTRRIVDDTSSDAARGSTSKEPNES
ncbi:MAG: hypothetical protein ABI551_27770, partial [Polyangiaceae bacterium]